MKPAADGSAAGSSDAPPTTLLLGIEAARLVKDVRGIGRYVRALLPRLLKQRPELRLVLFVRRARDIAPLHELARALGLAPDRVVVRLRREMARVPADVFWYPWNIARPAPRRGVVVVTIHDIVPLVMPDPRPWRWLKNYGWRRRHRNSVRRAAMILTVSTFTADEVQRVLGVPRSRLRVTLLGADDLATPPAERDEEALARLGVDGPFLLAVGAAERRKNLRLLDRAMPCVVAAFPGVTLVLAGPRRSDQRETGEPAWQRTLGFVTEEDLVSLYRSARALVTPSSYEGFGLPVLEAMRLGTPVICSRAASLPEVAGDAAEYVDPDDHVALADAIIRVLGDELQWASMRAASLAQSARFGWDETARRTLAAFDDALAMSGDA